MYVTGDTAPESCTLTSRDLPVRGHMYKMFSICLEFALSHEYKNLKACPKEDSGIADSDVRVSHWEFP